ncbi:hypothetical protein [Lysobacter sp. GCM10012299]|uniref:HvfA family oxazolone/thioamide-modified RiPP metallophore n=1 Tax=Lysobacter sp. GCM10012299 TaxID=3317333 RepID=UPI00360A2AC4
MSKQTNKPIALALGAIVGGLALSGSAFAMSDLASGYMLGAGAAASDNKAAEGSCGVDKMDTDKDGKVSKAEFGAAHKGDTSKFAAHDANKDGFITADEVKATEGKCGADKDKKKAGEGKCGEGKCGGSA